MTPADKLAAVVAELSARSIEWENNYKYPTHLRSLIAYNLQKTAHLLQPILAELQRAQGLTEKRVRDAVFEADGDYEVTKYEYMDWGKLTTMLTDNG